MTGEQRTTSSFVKPEGTYPLTYRRSNISTSLSVGHTWWKTSPIISKSQLVFDNFTTTAYLVKDPSIRHHHRCPATTAEYPSNHRQWHGKRKYNCCHASHMENWSKSTIASVSLATTVTAPPIAAYYLSSSSLSPSLFPSFSSYASISVVVEIHLQFVDFALFPNLSYESILSASISHCHSPIHRNYVRLKHVQSKANPD